MKSLRLLRAFLYALVAPIVWALGIRTRARTTRATAPVFGPSGPWMRAHVAAILPNVAPRAHHAHRRARPAPVPPPPHILALLAAAPDVEPEFVRPAPTLAPHPTVVTQGEATPAPMVQAAPAPRRRLRQRIRTWLPNLALRLTRGCRAVAEWLVFDSPPDARRA